MKRLSVSQYKESCSCWEYLSYLSHKLQQKDQSC